MVPVVVLAAAAVVVVVGNIFVGPPNDLVAQSHRNNIDRS